MASRALQATSRRLATQSTAFNFNLTRFASPLAIATCASGLQLRRAVSIAHQTTNGNEILAQQRLKRPVSPHLGIYKPQITWYPSALNRVTGSILSGAFYIFGFGYLVTPYIGWHWNSAALAASFAAWPLVAKIGLKAFMAFPFTFHCINGLRHLSWDFALGMSNKTVAWTGWAAVGATVVSSLYLMFAY